MSNKCYAVLLVLAGIFCGILIVSLSSSPAAAKLPAERRGTTRAGLGVPPVYVKPMVAPANIRVYPVGMGGSSNAHAYVVKDGQLWHCVGMSARKVSFR